MVTPNLRTTSPDLSPQPASEHKHQHPNRDGLQRDYHVTATHLNKTDKRPNPRTYDPCARHCQRLGSCQLGAHVWAPSYPQMSSHRTHARSAVTTSPRPSPTTLRCSSRDPRRSLRAPCRAPRRPCLGISGQGYCETQRWRARAPCRSPPVQQSSQAMALASARYVVPAKVAANAEEADLDKYRTTGQIPVPERPLRASVSVFRTCPLLRRQAMAGCVMACERGVYMSSGWAALGAPV